MWFVSVNKKLIKQINFWMPNGWPLVSVPSSDIYLRKMEEDVVMLTQIYSISHMLTTNILEERRMDQISFLTSLLFIEGI